MRFTCVLTVPSLRKRRGRDLGVRAAARDLLEDLELALGQLVGLRRAAAGRARAGHELLDQPARDLGREQRLAGATVRIASMMRSAGRS